MGHGYMGWGDPPQLGQPAVTVRIFFLELYNVLTLRLCLDTPKNPKLYKIPYHIEYCGTCMKQ